MTPRIIPFPSGSQGPKKKETSSRYFPYGKLEPFYVFCQLMLMTGILLWAMGVEITSFQGHLSSKPLNVMFCSMVLYWAFIHQQIQRTGFFRKNKMALFILGAIFLALVVLDPIMAAFIGVSVLIYFGFYGRAAYGPSAFVRHHLLTFIVAATMLLWIGLLSSSILSLVMTFVKLFPLGLILGALGLVQFWGTFAIVALVVLSGLFSAIASLCNRTVYLPFVTGQVTYWA